MLVLMISEAVSPPMYAELFIDWIIALFETLIISSL